jgi:hypothetical protein
MPLMWGTDAAVRATADETYAISGKRSLRIPGGNQSPVTQDGLPHGGARECVLTLRLLTEGGAVEIRPIWVQFWTPGMPAKSEILGVGGDEPWWHEIKVTLKVPEGTTHGRVVFQPPVAGRMWIDAVSLKTDAGAELVINGDMEQ